MQYLLYLGQGISFLLFSLQYLDLFCVVPCYDSQFCLMYQQTYFINDNYNIDNKNSIQATNQRTDLSNHNILG